MPEGLTTAASAAGEGSGGRHRGAKVARDGDGGKGVTGDHGTDGGTGGPDDHGEGEGSSQASGHDPVHGVGGPDAANTGGPGRTAAAPGLVTMDPAAPDHHTPIKSGHELRTAHADSVHTHKQDIHKRFIPVIRLMTLAEVIVYLAAAVALIVLSGVVLYRAADDVYQIIAQYTHSRPGHDNTLTFANNIVDALSEFLFVVILMELLATLITHIRHETFQVKPFVIIGIISGVRQILLVGAHLSLGSYTTSTEWRHAQIELGVNVGIDLLLVVCLVLLKHFQVESERV